MSFQILLDEIENNLKIALKELNFPTVSFSVAASKKGFGDVSCNVCFLLAKDLKKKPNEIASSIVANYQKYFKGLVLE